VRITRVRIADFRSYSRIEAQPAGLTVLVGPNGSGKTNLVEAIQLASTGRSFRGPALDQVVRWGAPAASVLVQAKGRSTDPTLEVEVSSAGKRTHKVNGKAKRRLADVVGRVPCVVFTPDDLRLVKGSADRRRGGLDDVVEQTRPSYSSVRRDYGRALRQRNLLLKEGAPKPQIEPWSEQISALGGRVVEARTAVLEGLREAASTSYSEIAGTEELAAHYSFQAPGTTLEGPMSAADASAHIAEALERREEEERARRATLAGPHRDDVVFLVADRDARAFASQGQQRSVALAWKIGSVEIIDRATGRRPVLLLDDVMSELDESRRTALAGLVETDTQTFITTTNIGYFDPATLMGAEVIELP
jgi:DNA replication and repair protein RecF